MELIAHRGGAALGAENAIATIETSIAAGADGVEIDVRLRTDGTIVLSHDPIPADDRAERATLRAVLDHVPADRLLVVELKGHPWEAGYDPAEPLAHAVAGMLSKEERRLVVSSFNPLALAVIREQLPRVATAVLTSPAFDLGSNLAAAVAGGHAECHVPAELLDEPFVATAHAAGRRVVAWTVDDSQRLRAFARWGVDGAICDDPRAARAALRQQGE